jgi:hypothetical protein
MKRNGKHRTDGQIRLQVLERLTLLELLKGVTGGFVTLGILEHLNQRLVLSRPEIKRLKVREQSGQVIWDAEADVAKPFRFESLERGLVAKRLRELAKANQLTLLHKPLVSKFIGDAVFTEGDEA